MAGYSDRTPVASTQHLPCGSDGNSMDNTISDHNGDYLQRRFYTLPRHNHQSTAHPLLPEMGTHTGRNANGIPHGNAGMRRVWTRSFAGDDVRFGARIVVRYTGERMAISLFSIHSRLDCCYESACFNRLLRRHVKSI